MAIFTNPPAGRLFREMSERRCLRACKSPPIGVRTMPSWFPLESNPELMSKYVFDLGATDGLAVEEVHLLTLPRPLQLPLSCRLQQQTPLHACVRPLQVLSVEDWALEMVPGTVHAVLFLFPLSEKQREHEKAHTPPPLDTTDPAAPFFMRQTVGNACGTVALLHALGNLERRGGGVAREGTWLQRFLQDTPTKMPDEIAEYIASGEASDELAKVH